LNIVSEKTGDAARAFGYKVMLDLINDYSELRGVFAADPNIAQRDCPGCGRKHDEQNGA
jgi:ABC-type sugar transport system substrate-binding protein